MLLNLYVAYFIFFTRFKTICLNDKNSIIIIFSLFRKVISEINSYHVYTNYDIMVVYFSYSREPKSEYSLKCSLYTNINALLIGF